MFFIQDKENRSGSPEKQVDKEEKEGEGMQFSSLYKNLKQPSKIGRTMSDNLSVPLAFIGECENILCRIFIMMWSFSALLHLCNEQNLNLTPSEEMEDFNISMP